MTARPEPWSPDAIQEIVDDIRLDFLLHGASYDESIKAAIARDLAYWEIQLERSKRGELQYRRAA